MSDDNDDQGLHQDAGPYVEDSRVDPLEDEDDLSDESLVEKVKDALVGDEDQIKSDDDPE